MAAERQHGPHDAAVAAPLLMLGEVLGGLGRLPEAEPHERRALAIREAALGPNHPDTAAALVALAGTFSQTSRLAEAELFFKRARAIYETALDTHHVEVGKVAGYLAGLYRAQGRYAEAEPLYQRSLAIREKALGHDHPDVAASLNNLATLYQAQGRYADAEPLYQRSLGIFEKALGHDNPWVATALNNLALLYWAQGRYAEAEPLYQRSLAIREKALGPNHLDVGQSLNNLAALFESQGRYAEAEPLYQRSLGIYEKALGHDHPSVANLLNNVAELYRVQGRYGDAEPLYRRSLGIIEKALGTEHPDVALITGNLGTLLKSEGRIDEAAPLLTRALEAGQKALGPDHPRVVGSMIQLAELYGLQGRTADAQQLFAKAGAAKSVDLKEFPIYFATNRKRDASQKRIAFGNERNLGKLELGIIKVVVPPVSASSTPGGRSAGQAAEIRISDVRQLAIQPAELSDPDKLAHDARQRLLGARAYLGQALVFVHGYNVSFDNAVRRAGQLAYDLAFDGPVFVFSWPSREKLLSYVGDRESAQLSADGLREFLETVVAETRAKRIHIIAHSMGNVALNEALQTMEPEALKKLNLGEMVLASPDLDPDLFQRSYRRLQQRGATITVYGASSDRALGLSSWLRDRPQLGFIPSGGPTRLVAGADLIDITAVNSDVFSLNHDLYANSPAIIGDLRRLMKDGQRPPDARTGELVKVPAAGGVYWRYQLPASKP
jgi:esterase/lipase superfamily enzyme/Tfp pilus assembly protein PilF